MYGVGLSCCVSCGPPGAGNVGKVEESGIAIASDWFSPGSHAIYLTRRAHLKLGGIM